MTTRIPGGGIALTLKPSDLRRMAEANGPLPRYCIAKDRLKWRVYDDVNRRFAESSDKASKRPEARARAHKMNVEAAERAARRDLNPQAFEEDPEDTHECGDAGPFGCDGRRLD